MENKSIVVKISVLFVLMVLVPLVFTSTLTYLQAKQQLTARILEQLDSIASLQKHRIIDLLEDYEEHAKLMTSRVILRESFAQYDKYGKEEDKNTVKRIIEVIPQAVKNFREISLVNLEGKVLASTNEQSEGKHVTQLVMEKGIQKFGLVDMFRDSNGNIFSILAGPMYLDNNLIGIAVIFSDADEITRISADYSGLGLTGETVIGKKDREGNALFITPTRKDPDAALKRTIPKEQMEIPMTHALQNKEMTFANMLGYEGVPILAATKYVGNVGWGIVAKMDREEAFAPVNQLRKQMFLTILITFFVVSLIGLATARSIATPIRKLTEVIDEISRGRLDVEIDESIKKSPDETGALARAFERTIVSLKLAMQLKKENGKNGKKE